MRDSMQSCLGYLQIRDIWLFEILIQLRPSVRQLFQCNTTWNTYYGVLSNALLCICRMSHLYLVVDVMVVVSCLLLDSGVAQRGGFLLR